METFLLFSTMLLPWIAYSFNRIRDCLHVCSGNQPLVGQSGVKEADETVHSFRGPQLVSLTATAEHFIQGCI